MSLSLWLYAIPEALDSSLSQEKEMKGIYTGEAKLPLCTNGMTVYGEKADGIYSEATKTKCVFSEAAGYKSMCKDQHCFYTLMEIKIKDLTCKNRYL